MLGITYSQHLQDKSIIMRVKKMQILISTLLGLVLLSITITPSSGQLESKHGVCWDNINGCISENYNQRLTNPVFDPTSPMYNPYEYQCCPLIGQALITDPVCFCSIGPELHGTDNGILVAENLVSCGAVDSLTAFDLLCPGQPLQENCWTKIGTCIKNNENLSATDPKFDLKSPSFNITEFLCCPLMKIFVTIDKPCFCAIDIFIHQNPAQAVAALNILSACAGGPVTLDSLDSFCGLPFDGPVVIFDFNFDAIPNTVGR